MSRSSTARRWEGLSPSSCRSTLAAHSPSARSMPDGYATVSLVLEVKDQSELTSVINKLGQIQGVYQVKRAAG